LAIFSVPGTDLDLGDVSYGNPFDSSWPIFFHYSSFVDVPYSPPGPPPGRIPAGVEGFTTTLPTANSPLQPIVSPPVNARINGVDFFQDQTGVGLTPTLQWNPPAVGSAAAYQLQFCLFLFFPGAITCSGTWITNTTTLTVPPGQLQAGNYYFVRLGVISQPGLDISTAPFKIAYPRGTAEALSGIISP
jgi:hypothetical protein